jgi:hypothetical protein
MSRLKKRPKPRDHEQSPLLRIWERRHVNGVLTTVTSVPGFGSWEVCVSHPFRPHSEQVGEHFALLTEAQAAADRHALANLSHDCTLCEQWHPVEKRRKGP